jgi:gamma-glutamyltranspeptidase / glutathione hydrolase
MSFAIAAGHDATADTALEILKSGGNAFDAAIAAMMTAFVAEPGMASGGGGAFANIRKADGTCLIFDFFSQTPRLKRPVKEVDFFPVEVDFGTTIEIFHVGKGATAVPGSIAGLFALHEQLGTVPMKRLVEIPIKYAREGVLITEFQHYDFQLLENIFRIDPKAQSLFFKNGELKNIGDSIKMPGLADFLEYMADEGAAAFYKGEIAAKIIKDHSEGGGYLTQEDFDNYEVIIRKPLAFRYKGKTILTNPFPSIGGKLIAHTMHYLEEEPLIGECLGDEHLKRLYKILQKTDALGKFSVDLKSSFNSIIKNKKHGSTSHLSIVDKWSNAISLTMTNGEGSGYFVENTDIQLNNMLGESALVPSGFHSWDPDIRLSSMMAPTIVLGQNQSVEIVTGSAGASRIASAITQLLHYLIDYKLSVEQAVNLPRVHLEHGVFNMESGFKHNLKSTFFADELKEWQDKSLFFGGAHTILSRKGSLYASGDDRREGVIRID